MDFSFADVSTGGGMAGVALLFAVFGFLRGLVKIVFSLVALAAGVIAGMWGYQHGDSIAAKLIDQPDPWMAYIVAMVIGFGSYSISRSVLNFFTRSVNQSSAVRRIGFGAPAGVFGLLFGSIVSFAGLSGVKYMGSVAELKHLDSHIHQAIELTEDIPLLVKIKQTIDASAPGRWHQKIDPINDEAELNLAKLFVIRQSRYHAARASASSSGRRVLGQPDVTQLLISGRKIAQFAKDKDFAALLNDEELKKTAQIPSAGKALIATNVEKAIGLFR